MKYTKARCNIKNGDIILVKRNRGLLAKLTTFLTKSPYTHTAIAFWINQRLCITEMNGGGNHIVPLSQQVKFGFDVYKKPDSIDFLDLEKSIWKELGYKTIYSWKDIFFAGLGEILQRKFPTSGTGKICSSHSALLYRMAGWEREMPSITVPRDFGYILEFKISVDEERGKRFNG